MAFTLPDPGTVNLEFERPADRARLERTAAALAGRGFVAQVADDAAACPAARAGGDPGGRRGAHRALRDAADARHHRRDRRVRTLRLGAGEAEARSTARRRAARCESSAPHPTTSSAAHTRSPTTARSSSARAPAASWVRMHTPPAASSSFGHQKLVRDVDEGLRRVREYSLPREYARMHALRGSGSLLAKTLIISYEPSGRIKVILVPETLGF